MSWAFLKFSFLDIHGKFARESCTEASSNPEFLSLDDRSIWANAVYEGSTFMDEYYKNSLVKESSEMDRIRDAVRDAGIFVVLGYSERHNGSLYISQVSQGASSIK